MREAPFKRAAEVTLAIRRPVVGRELRALLVARIRPMVDYLASELAELVMHRLESDLERVHEAVEVAVSAFASEVAHADADRPPHDPVSPVQSSSSGGLRGDDGRGAGRPAPCTVDGADAKQPAQETRTGREEGQRPARLVGPAVLLSKARPDLVEAGARLGAARGTPDPLATVRGPVLATMMAPPAKAAGKLTCRKCGYVGGNARGCGTAHNTLVHMVPEWDAPLTALEPSRRLAPTPAAVATAKARIANRSAAAALADMRTRRPNRPAIAAAADLELEHEPDDQRWSPQRIATETALAEGRKAVGSLPAARSTWSFDAGRPRELDIEDSE